MDRQIKQRNTFWQKTESLCHLLQIKHYAFTQPWLASHERFALKRFKVARLIKESREYRIRVCSSTILSLDCCVERRSAGNRRVDTFCFAPHWSTMLNQYPDLPLAGLDRFARPVRKTVVDPESYHVPRTRDVSSRERDSLADKSSWEVGRPATAHSPIEKTLTKNPEELASAERFTIASYSRSPSGTSLSFRDFAVEAIRALTSFYCYHKNDNISSLSLPIRLTN